MPQGGLRKACGRLFNASRLRALRSDDTYRDSFELETATYNSWLGATHLVSGQRGSSRRCPAICRHRWCCRATGGGCVLILALVCYVLAAVVDLAMHARQSSCAGGACIEELRLSDTCSQSISVAARVRWEWRPWSSVVLDTVDISFTSSDAIVANASLRTPVMLVHGEHSLQLNACASARTQAAPPSVHTCCVATPWQAAHTLARALTPTYTQARTDRMITAPSFHAIRANTGVSCLRTRWTWHKLSLPSCPPHPTTPASRYACARPSGLPPSLCVSRCHVRSPRSNTTPKCDATAPARQAATTPPPPPPWRPAAHVALAFVGRGWCALSEVRARGRRRHRTHHVRQLLVQR